jgi:hypothetical protein
MALGTLELLNGTNEHSRRPTTSTSVVEPKAPMAAIVEHGPAVTVALVTQRM